MAKFTRREFVQRSTIAGVGLALPWELSQNRALGAKPPPPPPPAGGQVPLSPKAIKQFVDPLPTLGDMDFRVAGTQPIELEMTEFEAEILPAGTPLAIPVPAGQKPRTWVWGYKPANSTRKSYIGPVILATRGTPTNIRFINNLGSAATTKVLAYKNSTDQTLAWADPLSLELNRCAALVGTPGQPDNACAMNYTGPIPACVHIHGGEVPAWLDGGPDAWFTPDGRSVGHGYYTKGFIGNFPSLDVLPNAAQGSIAFVRTMTDARGLYEMGNTGWVRKTMGDAVYCYPNTQESAPVWFHDHTLGATRLNVYAGLAGAYYLTDSVNDPSVATIGADLPPLEALVIQDRMFDTTGQLYFPAGVPFIPNPDHPFWVPEFVGDVICVNGKTWPYMNVESKRYQFLIINGSNARTYEMFLVNNVTKVMGPPIWQIGTDGGYLDAPVIIDPNAVAPQPTRLVLMPGERATIIVDFAGQPVGSTFLLKNLAKTPYPAGAAATGGTTGQIMLFRVTSAATSDASYNPASGGSLRPNNPIERLCDPVTGTIPPALTPPVTRRLTLNEVMGMPVTLNGIAYPGGPLEVLMNNTKYMGESTRNDPDGYQDFRLLNVNGVATYYSELPQEGTTELWEIINLTADAHPIHTHLTQCQLLNRQAFDVPGYFAAYALAYGGVIKDAFGPPLDYNKTGNADPTLGGNPAVTPFLKGASAPPLPNEAGWKDTIRAMPGEVTRILVRYSPTDTPAGTAGAYPFNPNHGHGYAWHCHIVDHEDNEMMRPISVQVDPATPRSYIDGRDY